MLALNGVLGQMITMVNALQIIIDVYCLINIAAPANVGIVMR